MNCLMQYWLLQEKNRKLPDKIYYRIPLLWLGWDFGKFKKQAVWPAFLLIKLFLKKIMFDVLFKNIGLLWRYNN